jgi:tight adherence protein C
MTVLRLLLPLLLGAGAWTVIVHVTRALGPPPIRVSALVRPPSPRSGRSPPTRRRALLIACAAVLPMAVVGLPLVALAAAGLLVAPRLNGWFARRRLARHVAAEVPDVVDLLTVAVGAGLTVREAVSAVADRPAGPLARALGAVVADAEAGRPFADALDDLPQRAGESTRPLAASLAGCVRYGSPIGPALAALAAEARDAERRRMEQAARRVPVLLLFPLVLCILPAFALLTVAPLLADALRALRL